ncbi:MAG: transcriptional regulator NanR [Pseudomonadota bacterium]
MTTQSLPIRRRKLADDVEDRIITHIQDKRLKPGDTLSSERELMLLYQVGRPAIREAMQSLQRKGLVEIKHGERPRVAEPSLESMAEQMSQTMRHLLSHNAATMENLKEARSTFEAEMARIAARRATPDDVHKLEDILERQKGLRAEPARFLKCDGELHAAIASISGNPIFVSLSQALFDWLANFHVDLVRKRGLEKLTLEEHASIIAAIAARDPEAAGQRMADHLDRANTLYHQEHLSE